MARRTRKTQSDIPRNVVKIGKRRPTQAQYATIRETARDGVWIIDLKGRFLDVNDSYCQMTGYTREELLTMSMTDIEALEEPGETAKHIKKIIEQGYNRFETCHKCKDGKIIECEVSAKYRDFGGAQIIVLIRNLTERKSAKAALRKSETRFQDLTDLLPEGVCELDLDGKLTFANKRAFELSGYSQEDLDRGLNAFQMFIPEDRARVKQNIARLLAGKDLGLQEYTAQRKDGSRFSVMIHSACIVDNDKVVGVRGIIIDITERRQAEEALKQTEEKYRELAESITDIFFAMDEELKYTYWNRASEELTGILGKDALGKSLYDLFPDTEDTRRAEKVYRQVLETKQPQHFVNEYQLGGKNFTFEISAYPSRDGISVFTKDVTDRKRAEKTLLEFGQRLDLALKGAQEGVWDWNTETDAVWYSPRWKEMLGYTDAEIEPHVSSWERLLHPDDVGPVREMVDAVLRGKSQYNIEFSLKHKDGHYVDILSRGFPIRREPGGPIVRIVGTHFDLTERKRYESELRSLYHNELQLRQKLEKERNKRIEFTHALVHELKTPLTPVMTSSEMLVQELAEGRQRRLAKNVYNGAADLAKRIDELLELAKMEIGTLNLNLRPVDTLKLIRRTVNYMRPQASNKHQFLSCRLPEFLPNITADADRLKQILMNLIGNALKHTPPQSEIAVSARREGDNLVIEVQDNGQGISDEMQERLFEPYFRLESRRDNLNGLGLGLPISRQIVELHGGRMWVKSEIGKGSTFAFSLPLSAQTGNKEVGLDETTKNIDH